MSLFLLLFLAIPTQAAQKTVYLSANGTVDADGSLEKPFGNLSDAISAVADGGTVVVIDRFTLETNGVVNGVPVFFEPNHSGKIFFTAKDSKTDYRATGACFVIPKKMGYEMAGENVYDAITFESEGVETLWIGNFHPMTFGTDFVSSNTKGSAKYLYVIGGYYAPAEDLPTAGNPKITISGGCFYRVIGFTHVKGYKTYTFTGQSTIIVNGGVIERVFGGSTLNHYSGSTQIIVNGGVIDELFTAGDATRPLKGNATVTLNGGTVKSLYFNNITGQGMLTLNNGALGKYTETYGNATLKANAAGSERILKYNSVAYSAEFVRTLGTFTKIERFGAVYVNDNGTGDGTSPEKAMNNYAEALKKLATGGGMLCITGRVTLSNFTEPAHVEPIVITGGELIAENYSLSGDTFFADTVLSVGTLYADMHRLTIADVTFIKKTNVDGSLVKIAGGEYGNISLSGDTVAFSLVGGKADTVTLGGKADSAILSFLDCHVAELTVESKAANTLEIELNAAIDCFTLQENAAKSLTIHLGKVENSEIILKTDAKSSTLLYDAKETPMALVEKIRGLFDKVSATKTAYLAAGGTGTGFSRQNPAGDLVTAFNYVTDGGEVVLLSDFTLDCVTVLPNSEHEVTLRAENGATLHIGSTLAFGCPIIVRDIGLSSGSEDAKLVFRGRTATVGENVASICDAGISNYITLIAGNIDGTAVGHTDLTVKGGVWQTVYGGSYNGSFDEADYHLTVTDGSFYGKVYASGVGTQSGNAVVKISDGTFYRGLFGTAVAANKDSYIGSILMTISGGVFYGKIAPGTSYDQSINGTYTLIIQGGDFRHLTDFEGAEKYFGSCESHIVFDGVDANAKQIGTYTFKNPVRRTADPRIALVDGMYYYVFTSGSTLRVYKAANVTDLAYAEGVLVWDARNYATFLDGRTANIWPSEIQYFSAEEFGENAGWYLFFSTYEDPGDGGSDGSTRRSYVLKAKNDDLQGEWVNPVTGKVGVPELFVSDTEVWVNTVDWTAGESTLRYNGKVYALWIEQRDRGTEAFRQMMFLSEMKNPWTVTGKVLTLVQPEYAWEKVGHAYDSAKKIWYPAVIEGATPIVSDDNRLFVLYAASGYWTTEYALGQMTFMGGDIFDIANWKKSPSSVFSKNSEVNGIGGPSIFTMADGTGRYILYHGYLGTDTASGRYCFMEPYTIDETGVHIGVNGHPSPLSTVFEVPYNPTPLHYRVSGFAENKTSEEDVSTTTATVTTMTSIQPIDVTNKVNLAVWFIPIAVSAVAVGVLILIRLRKK